LADVTAHSQRHEPERDSQSGLSARQGVIDVTRGLARITLLRVTVPRRIGGEQW